MTVSPSPQIVGSLHNFHRNIHGPHQVHNMPYIFSWWLGISIWVRGQYRTSLECRYWPSNRTTTQRLPSGVDYLSVSPDGRTPVSGSSGDIIWHEDQIDSLRFHFYCDNSFHIADHVFFYDMGTNSPSPCPSIIADIFSSHSPVFSQPIAIWQPTTIWPGYVRICQIRPVSILSTIQPQLLKTPNMARSNCLWRAGRFDDYCRL